MSSRILRRFRSYGSPPDGRALAASLIALVEDELCQSVDARVSAMAGAIAARYGTAARAVLFYGSCLRSDMLEGQMLDFYLIVSDYRAAYASRWLAVANRLIPPNVFPFTHEGLAAKFAVLSEADFASLNGPDASTVSVWARFAQPARLVWRADPAAAERAIVAVARAAPTLLAAAAPLADRSADSDPLALWRTGFALTYGAELRAERKDRSTSIVDADPERYRRFTAAALQAAAIDRAAAPPDARAAAERRWRGLRRRGKLLTAVRLVKASTTFAGGIDYLAWKIDRHAGTRIAIRPWQRRFPLLGALTMLPRLLRSRAVR